MQRFLFCRHHNNMRLLFILSAVLLFIIPGCSKKTEDKNGVQLRIENLNNATLDSLVVQNPAGRQVFYTIAPGTKSAYKVFDYIYNYAYIKAYYSNQTLVLQPIDYVGETKLETGNFTYKIYVISNFTSSFLSVENTKD